MVRQLLTFFLLSLCALSPWQGAIAQEIPIGTGDTLVVSVYNEPDLSVRATVNSDGFLRFPLIGPIKVIGKTPTSLSIELAKAYEDGYLVAPNVSVFIESYRPFFIRGAVNKPGSYMFSLNLTVDQALAVAGGLKDRASEKNWYIIRGAEKQRIPVARDSKVLPGDIITIEESLF